MNHNLSKLWLLFIGCLLPVAAMAQEIVPVEIVPAEIEIAEVGPVVEEFRPFAGRSVWLPMGLGRVGAVNGIAHFQGDLLVLTALGELYRRGQDGFELVFATMRVEGEALDDEDLHQRVVDRMDELIDPGSDDPAEVYNDDEEFTDTEILEAVDAQRELAMEEIGEAFDVAHAELLQEQARELDGAVASSLWVENGKLWLMTSGGTLTASTTAYEFSPSDDLDLVAPPVQVSLRSGGSVWADQRGVFRTDSRTGTQVAALGLSGGIRSIVEADDGHLFAAGERGCFESSDGGYSFTPLNTGLMNMSAYAVLVLDGRIILGSDDGLLALHVSEELVDFGGGDDYPKINTLFSLAASRPGIVVDLNLNARKWRALIPSLVLEGVYLPGASLSWAESSGTERSPDGLWTIVSRFEWDGVRRASELSEPIVINREVFNGGPIDHQVMVSRLRSAGNRYEAAVASKLVRLYNKRAALASLPLADEIAKRTKNALEVMEVEAQISVLVGRWFSSSPSIKELK
jgi:hypothetical protein